MSDQYYYFLGGEERGPLSRMAAERMALSGKADGALFRQDPSQPWQTAAELGLMPTAVLQSPDPAVPREHRPVTVEAQKNTGKQSSYSSLRLFVGAVAIAGGLFLLVQKLLPATTAATTKKVAPAAYQSEDADDSSLNQNLHRFDSAIEVLDLARRKATSDWTTDSMRECSCNIVGNVIELSADRRIVLYNGASGPSVIAYYWEDNHGNPYTHFYRYDGSWVDAGHDVMPGYTGDYNDYFEATPKGISKWQGNGKPPRNYVYRSGVFEAVM